MEEEVITDDVAIDAPSVEPAAESVSSVDDSQETEAEVLNSSTVDDVVTYSFFDSSGDLIATTDTNYNSSPTLAASTGGVYSSADTGTYYTLASRYVENNIPCDYIFFRSGQYEYTCFVGDIVHSGSSYTCSGGRYSRWYRDGSNYAYLVQTGAADLNIDAGSYIVFSSFDDAPSLDVSTGFQTYVIAVIAVIALAVFCIHQMFKWCLRSKEI